LRSASLSVPDDVKNATCQNATCRAHRLWDWGFKSIKTRPWFLSVSLSNFFTELTSTIFRPRRRRIVCLPLKWLPLLGFFSNRRQASRSIHPFFRLPVTLVISPPSQTIRFFISRQNAAISQVSLC